MPRRITFPLTIYRGMKPLLQFTNLLIAFPRCLVSECELHVLATKSLTFASSDLLNFPDTRPYR